MGRYTETRTDMMKISPDEDNYEKALEDATNTFRTFDEALDNFLVEKGYRGDVDDCKAKTDYIQSRFESASVDSIKTRTLKKWFSVKENNENHQNKEYFTPLKLKREFLFRFCFAFRLCIAESNEFFRKVCLQRSFDCHDIQEAVYYYALSHQLSYQEAKTLIDEVLKGKEKIEKGTINSDNKLYTEKIKEYIDGFKNADQLVQYLRDNYSQFEYNNATAYKYINTMWTRISDAEGLANCEKNEIFNNEYEHNDGCPYLGVVLCKDCEEKKNCKYVDRNKYSYKKDIWNPRSDWEIYLQILGLDGTFKNNKNILQKGNNKDIIIHSILKDNKLLHPLAADSFPDRQGLQAILRKEHKSDELVRKIMILLSFYEFWINKALEPMGEKNGRYEAKDDGDEERCTARINHFLVESGYPELYVGNPFDWIFLHSAHQIEPLNIFREFMHTLYLVKEDELIPKA